MGWTSTDLSPTGVSEVLGIACSDDVRFGLDEFHKTFYKKVRDIEI